MMSKLKDKALDSSIKGKLIVAVREYPAIYDKAHPAHFDIIAKTKIWKEILADLKPVPKEVDGKHMFQLILLSD